MRCFSFGQLQTQSQTERFFHRNSKFSVVLSKTIWYNGGDREYTLKESREFSQTYRSDRIMYLKLPDKDPSEHKEDLSQEDVNTVENGCLGSSDYAPSIEEAPDSVSVASTDNAEAENAECLKIETDENKTSSEKSEEFLISHNENEKLSHVAEENSPETEHKTILENSEESEGKSVLPEAPATVENTPAENSDQKKSRKEGFSATILDFVELVTVSLTIVMLLLTFVLRHSPVIGPSMNPTIEGSSKTGSETKDVLLISKMFYTPKRGDIVVLQTTNVEGTVQNSLNHPIVKRIIAIGGDTLVIDRENWKVTVTDSSGNVAYEEQGRGSTSYVNYTDADMRTGYFTGTGNVCTLKIPEGYVFVMGDNRNNSRDSRDIGFIDERLIVGRSILRIFPFDRFGTVN